MTLHDKVSSIFLKKNNHFIKDRKANHLNYIYITLNEGTYSLMLTVECDTVHINLRKFKSI